MATYFGNIWNSIYTALVGMKVTIDHMFQKKVTLQYPDHYHPIRDEQMPENARNRLYLDINKCDGCSACVRACPSDCITVEIAKVTPGDPEVPALADGKPRKTWVTRYDIDFGLCCFCSLCTEACPTDAIQMTQEFEYSTYNRRNLIYSFSDLTPDRAAAKKEMYAKYAEEKKRAEAEAKAKAAAEEAKKADGATAPDAKQITK
ncbi:MAG: NuoI/complex I 23 kDa subunit family protein [Chloroflexota bacterium]